MNKRNSLVLGFVGVVLFSVFNTHMAFAEIAESSTIYQKAFYEGVVTCFNTAAENGGLKGTITLGDFDGSANNFFDNYKSVVKTVGDARYAKISCKSLLTEKTEKKLPTTTTSDATIKDQRLTDAKYSKDTTSAETSDGGACYSFKYKKYTTKKSGGDFVKENEYYTPQLCISKDANGNFVSSVKEIAGQYDYNEAGLAQRQLIKFENLGKNKLRLNVNTDNTGFLGIYTYTYKDYVLSDYVNESQIIAAVGNDIAAIMGSTVATSKVHNEDSVTTGTASGPGGYATTETWKQTYYAACQNFTYNSDNSGINCTSNQNYSVSFSSQASLDTVYKKMATHGYTQYSTVISNFSDDKYNYEKIKFSDDEIYDLYQYYLTSIYKVANINCTEIGTTLNGAGKYSARLWWSTENKYGNCYFDVDDKNKDIKVNGVYDTGIFGNEIGLDELNTKLNSLTNSVTPGSNIHANTDQTDEGVTQEEADCLSSGAAGSLGWIACPTISGMAEATDGISGLLNDWLSIDTKWYDPNDSNGAKTYEAWEIFRNIANIVMIIILLAIVFSQLTGVGIDNYGIKKMLPKLIIMAILINLSYIICEVVIDLSNILGAGLNKLFASIGESIGGRVTFGQGATTVVASILGVGSVAGMGAATVIPIAVSLVGGGGAMVIISLILVLLIALVAVLLFFASIGARMIIVILFTAISPLAFACYILPNTQTLFKKWLNVFKAAVLVYPICGALYGMARLVNNLIFSGSGTVGLPLALIGVCAPLIPFFALPSLLKGALTGLGVVGGALTAMSAGLKKGLRGANSAVQGTDQFKNAQNRGKVKTGAWSSGIFRDRMDRRIDRGLNDTDRARAQELRNKIRNNDFKDGENKEDLAKEYESLVNKSNNRLTEGQMARLADAQAKINAYESQKEKDEANSRDIVAAGMREKDSYANQNAADEAIGWNGSYYEGEDDEGNKVTYTYNSATGQYESFYNGKKHFKSSADIAKWVKGDKGSMISRRQATLNRDLNSRVKQAGDLASFATNNSDTLGTAATGSLLSAMENSQSAMVGMADSASDSVLQLRQEQNLDEHTKLRGNAFEAAELRAQGIATTLSLDAARRMANRQMTGESSAAAQNRAAADYANKVAAGVYDVRKINDDAVSAGAIKAVNQTTNTVETNAVGEVVIDRKVAQKNAQNAYNLADAKNNPDLVPEITEDYAKSLEQQRFDTSQRKMYGEEFKNQTRGQIGQIVNSMMNGSNTAHAGDANYMAAAISDFISKGGNEDFLNYVFANQTKIDSDPAIKSIIDSTMSTMPEGSAKQYGKYVNAIADYNANNGTNLVARGFADWMKGASPSESGIIADEKASFEGYLRSISGDITGRTKDEYKFMAGNPDVYKHINSADAYYAALSSKGDSLVAANKLVESVIGSDNTKRIDVINSIKIDDATKTMDSTWTAILGHDVSDVSFSPTGDTLTALQNFRNKLYDYDSGSGSYVPKKGLERAAANLSNNMKRILGV